MNKEKKNSRVVMLIIDALIAAVLLALDQFTKYLAVVHLKNQPAYVIIDGVLELQYLENRGSAFGMLQNQKVFILFVGIVFLAVLLFFLLKLPEQKKFRIVHVLLAVIIAGGIGNMIDRFRLDYVVDFISFVLINYPILMWRIFMWWWLPSACLSCFCLSIRKRIWSSLILSRTVIGR